MKIKKLSVEGFHKIRNATYEFKNNMYIVGPNGSGKSSIMKAIQLALLGYIPGTAKNTKAAIFQHRGDSRFMCVSLETDDGISITRTWTGTSSNINTSVEILPEGTDIESIISELELPIFNFNEFIGLSANKLKDWFLQFLPNSDRDIDWKTILSKSLEEKSIAIDDMLIDHTIQEFSGEGADPNDVRSANSWIKSCISFTKKEITRLESTLQSYAQYDDLEYVDVSAIDSKIKDLTEEIERYRKNELAKNMNKSIQSQLDELDIKYEDIDDDPYYREACNKKANIIENIESVKAVVEGFESACTEAEATFDQRTSELNALENKQNQLTEMLKTPTCPITNLPCESIKQVDSAEDIQHQLEEIATLIEEKTPAVEAARELVNKSWDELSANKGGLTVLEEQLQEVEKDLNTIEYRYSQRAKLIELKQPEMDLICDIDALTQELKTANDLKLKAATQEHDKKLKQIAQNDLVAAQYRLSAYKVWEQVTGVNGMQSDEYSQGPFIKFADSMSELLSKFFGDPTEAKFAVESSANSFTFGLNRSDKYIPYELLSSGEKCLFTLALSICIIRYSGSPLKVLMIDDILDHLDDKNVANVFESLSKIDDIQCIFAGVVSYPNQVDGWDFISLTNQM